MKQPRRCPRGWALLAAIWASTAAAEPLPGAPPMPAALQARLTQAAGEEAGPPRTRHRHPDGTARYSNRLVLESSPYLLQHAHNPVDWHAWGEQAFARARELDRPLFVSIGYSTCHWCHVMEEESFEDPAIAEQINRNFIAVKVDREERPDVDAVYMAAVQSLTGSGGWPLNVFLTPQGKPFYGGTYFPPRDRPGSGRASLPSVLARVAKSYAEDRDEVEAMSRRLVTAIRASLTPPASVGLPSLDQLDAAFVFYARRFDTVNGGLQRPTKFPSSLPISLLLRQARRTGSERALSMARQTLDAMARGGLYDHVGGGFHRYTTEPTWTVPHFEKMLYDNALLAVAYTDAYQVTGEPGYADVVRDVLRYLAREMTSPAGTLYAATDADSEGEEGTFFVWTPEQVRAAVGPELAPLALRAYGVTAGGNFEGGRTVLRRDTSAAELAAEVQLPLASVETRLETIRQRLRQARQQRVAPHTDTKQIVAWNGLAVSALARAGLVLGEPEWVERATRAASTLLERGRPAGRLARYLLEGKPHGTGLLDDHAFLIAGLLDVFEATGEISWLQEARRLQADLDARFFDDVEGGYFQTPSDGEALLVREKPASDGAIPGGNSVAALNLMRLALLTGEPEYGIHAEMTLRTLASLLETQAAQLPYLLEAVDFLLGGPREILLVTPGGREDADPFLRALAGVFLPNRVLVVAPEAELPTLVEQVPALRFKRALAGATTAYVCVEQVCDAPARDVATFSEQLRKAAAKR